MASREESVARAQGSGTVWLNDVFVVRDGRRRLFRRFSTRLNVAEMVWIGIFTVISAIVIFTVTTGLSYVPVISSLVSPLVFTGAAPFVGWFIGRRIARASPYRRHSGEGLTEYLWVQADKRGTIIGRLFGRRVAMNTCVTFVSGKREVVPCVEWIGTARAPMMPRDSIGSSNLDATPEEIRYMDVELPPACEPTDWTDRVRAERRRERDFLLPVRAPSPATSSVVLS